MRWYSNGEREGVRKGHLNKYVATLVNMGAVYIQTADYRKAQAMHRALNIFENIYGKTPHPHIG